MVFEGGKVLAGEVLEERWRCGKGGGDEGGRTWGLDGHREYLGGWCFVPGSDAQLVRTASGFAKKVLLELVTSILSGPGYHQ